MWLFCTFPRSILSITSHILILTCSVTFTYQTFFPWIPKWFFRLYDRFMRCHVNWERCVRHRVSIWIWWSSIASLFPADSLSQGELWDKERFQAAVVWAWKTAACTSCWSREAPAFDHQGLQWSKVFIKIAGKKFVLSKLSWKLIYQNQLCFVSWDGYVLPHKENW